MVHERRIFFGGTSSHGLNEDKLINEQLILEFMTWWSVNDHLASESMTLPNHLQKIEFEILAMGTAKVCIVNANKEHDDFGHTTSDLFFKLTPRPNNTGSRSSCVNDNVAANFIT